MGSNSSGKSETLMKVAQRLRLYKLHQSFDVSDDSDNVKDSKVEDSTDEFVPHGGGLNRAAVLICLFEGEKGDIRVILTKRSSKLSSHSGEVSLPGGKWEEGDRSDADTALREANEEIGLDLSIVEIVATLDPFYTTGNITVFPVIGILWDINGFNPVPNASEVESIFYAPLEMFLKNGSRREEKRDWMGYEYFVHFFEYRDENNSYIIWAFTASILIRAASIVYGRPPEFKVLMPKFWIRSRQ